jgi:hypothetical protein
LRPYNIREFIFYDVQAIFRYLLTHPFRSSLPAAAVCFALAGCSRNDPVSPDHTLALDYVLRVAAMHPDSISVGVTIGNLPANSSFILPFIYADNPIDSFSSPLVSSLSIIDANNSPVDFIQAEEMVGPVLTNVIRIPGQPLAPVTLTYAIRIDAIISDTAHGQGSLIMLDSNAGCILGNYLFAVPYSPSLVDIWRTPLNITLKVENTSGVELRGVPVSSSYRNAYELLFVQFFLGAETQGRGTGGGQAFNTYSFTGKEYPAEALNDAAVKAFTRILDEIIPIYGRLSQDEYAIMFHSISGGLEGANSFICSYPALNADSSMYMVLAHEAIHDRVDIACSERFQTVQIEKRSR